jgi:phosphatidylinositol-3-phosphatase
MKPDHPRPRLIALAAIGALGLNALLSGPVRAAAATGPCGTATSAPPVHFDHVVLLIFENKNQDQILSGTAAPYLKGLSQQCGRGTDMNTPDPLTSLGNYIALTSGYYGHPKHITANRGPSTWPQDSVSIFEQLGGDWTELAENAGGNCYTSNSAFNFTVDHTPAPYYTRIKSQCQTHDIPMGATPDLSAAFTLLSPNKSHIMHEDDAPGTTTQAQRIKAGDDWAAGYLPKVFASSQYQAGRTAVIITWDEATAKRNDVPFIVATPYTQPGYTTAAHMTHFSTLKGIEEMLGLPLLGHAGDSGVASIRDYFGLS